MGMATGSRRNDVQCDQRLYSSCGDGRVIGGEQFSVAAGRRRGAGDAEVTGQRCPFEEEEGAFLNENAQI